MALRSNHTSLISYWRPVTFWVLVHLQIQRWTTSGYYLSLKWNLKSFCISENWTIYAISNSIRTTEKAQDWLSTSLHLLSYLRVLRFRQVQCCSRSYTIHSIQQHAFLTVSARCLRHCGLTVQESVIISAMKMPDGTKFNVNEWWLIIAKPRGTQRKEYS